MSLWVKFLSVTIQMKATEQYFPVVWFIMLMVVLALASVDELVKCDHSDTNSYWSKYFSVVLFIMLCKVDLAFESVG